MISDAKQLLIETRVADVLKRLKVTSLPVDPIQIASDRDIEVIPKDMADRGVSGMLLQHGGKFAIMYATHIRSEGFKRFSIAHELGHYFLDGHPEKLFESGDTHVSKAGFASDSNLELEADHFAAALLMPRQLFLKAMDKRKDGLDAIEGLSDVCQTSRLATAIRYAETTFVPTAVVVSKGKSIEYAFLSKTMRENKRLTWPKRGSAVPKESATFALNSRSSAVASGERDEWESDFSIWLGGSPRLNLKEEVLGLGSFGRTLTVLTALPRDDDDDEDDNEDEDGDGRWRPRF